MKCITTHRVNGKKRHTPTYTTHHTMLQRCGNPRNPAYPRYGGRGIAVCPEWRDFRVFFADMGERPVGTTLDRIDNDRGYCKENCRWVSRLVQANNSSSVKRYTAHGMTMTLTEWAEHLRLPRECLRLRLKRKWPIDRVLKGYERHQTSNNTA